MKKGKLEVPVLPDDGMHDFMAVSANGWGTAPTVKEAMKIVMAEVGEEAGAIMVVPKGATMNALGNAIYWNSEIGHGAGFCERCVILTKGKRKEMCG